MEEHKSQESLKDLAKNFKGNFLTKTCTRNKSKQVFCLQAN